MSDELFDVVIIGGGCAGLAAALYAKRYELNVVVLAKELGGLITTTHIVENYPGLEPMSGWDMMSKFIHQMELFDVDVRSDVVEQIKQNDDSSFDVCTATGCLKSKTVILSTGTRHRELGVEGEQDFRNKGVSYCATCDGAFFKQVPIAIVGGGDSAAKEALLLSDYGSHVYVIARSTLKAEPINATRVAANNKITVLEGTQVLQVHGDEKGLTHVTLDKPFGGSDKLELGGLFVAIGHDAQTKLAEDMGVELNAKKEVKIDRTSRTSIPGFYAAGDCTDTGWKQAIISAAEGSQAANSAYEDITNEIVKPK